MKHIKRVLFAALLLTTAIKGWAADFEVDGIYYNITSTNPNEAEVAESAYSGYVEIPSSVNHDGINYTVTGIGSWAFHGCWQLTSVSIPNSVTSIGESAFQGCYNMTSVSIPNSVTVIEAGTFAHCYSLTSFTFPNSVTSVGIHAFYECRSLISIDIPDSVTNLEYGAFNSCMGLESVTIGNSMTTIESYVFDGCTGLTSVTIPNSVTSIGDDAFRLVPNIVYNGTATGSPWGARSVNGYVDGYLVYADDTKAELLACSSAASGEILIPNSVTTIGTKAFYSCSSLTSVTFGNSVISIGGSAFYNCSSLTGLLTIPNSVTSIGNGAFYDCSSLTSVVIGNSVTSIGNQAFSRCNSLGSVSIGSSVTSIGSHAFYFTGLTEVTIKAATPPSLDYRVFGSGLQLFAPCGSLEAYQSDPDWSTYFTSITDNVFPYDIVATQNNESLGNVVISQQPNCENDEASVRAEPSQGCAFSNWTVNGEVVSTDNPYTFAVENDIELVGNFRNLVDINEQMAQTKIYPNPANAYITIEAPMMKTVTLFDVLGIQRGSQEVHNGTMTWLLDGLSQGIYLLKVEFEDGRVGYARFMVVR